MRPWRITNVRFMLLFVTGGKEDIRFDVCVQNAIQADCIRNRYYYIEETQIHTGWQRAEKVFCCFFILRKHPGNKK